MRYAYKATTRIVSMILVITLMLTAFPASAFAAIDEPLSGETGNGWDNFGSSPGNETYTPPTTTQPNDSDTSEPNDEDIDNVSKTPDNATSKDNKEKETPVATPTSTPVATAGTLGTSGIAIDLSPDVLADFITFMENAEQAIASSQYQIRPFAGVGDTGTISWSWGETASFNAGGYYVNQIPSLTLSSSRPSEGRPFCAQFGPDPLTGGTYTAAAFNQATILKLMIAFNEGRASAVGVQLAIWSITNNASAFATHPEAQAALSAASGISTDGFTLLRWTTSGSYQPFFTVERELNDWRFKIIKKSTSGKLLPGATFSVSGPGVNETGLVTNTKGEILVDIPSPGGAYVVTETNPPSGYLPASPDSQTVTINTTNPAATVVFENEPEGEEETDEEESSFRIEVETEVSTDVTVQNAKQFEYSRAYGQFTLRKHDQDGKSLDGALFDIEVRFTDGTVLTENGWEVDNGARLFTYTHPENNHDAASVTVTEVQPPRYYTGDPAPKTVTIQPSYTRTVISMTWTETIWTYFYRYTVIEIDPSGEETDVESWTESRDEFEVTPGNVENFPEYVDGDREITVTFVNQRITGDIIVTKRDANTGLPLAGATVHLWGTDLGEPSTIDRTLVTGADGTVLFDNLPPGTYSYQETQPPFAYNLNSELQTAVLQSGQVLQKEIRNYRKDGLIIKKTDENGVPLPGAVFELRRGSGEVLLSEVTNENGIIFRDYLTEGLYVIEEKKAPESFLLAENPIKEIFIYESDDNKQYTVTFVNRRKPSIEITKVDEDNPTIKLEGAVFRITDTRTNQYWDIETGEDGTALLENLELNTTYIVEERVAPQGFVNSGYRQEIVLKECRIHTITVANHHMPKLTIIKKDINSHELLAEATFRVSWNNGADYQDVTTDANGEAVIPNLTPGWISVFEKNAPAKYQLDTTPQQILIVDGQDKVIEWFNEKKPSLTISKVDSVTKTPLQYARFKIEKKTETGTTLIGEYVTDSDGIICLENIGKGRFLITEVEAPSGFNIDRTTHEVTVEGECKIEFTNTAQSPIYIYKVDEKGNPIMGAKFKVTTMNGALIGTVSSGRTGYAIIPYVEPGWVCIEEIQAADGFILSSTPVNIEVKSGKPAQVEFVNYKKPQLSILKLDASDNKALMGARIKVTKANGEIIGTYTTDNNGLVTLTDLDVSSLVISEVAAPDGYILDSTPQIVELKAGDSKQIELYNTAMPGLQVRKINKSNNMPVANTVFSLVRLESGAKRDLGTFTTGANGLFYVPDLEPGNYVLSELTAAPGFILDPTPRSIYIEGGKLNTVEVFNVPYATLRILKISADDTRKPLEGAVFKLFDEKRLEIGTYTTSALGEILISEIPEGTVYLQEQKAPAGFVLDNTVRQIELVGGKTTTVEWKNTALGSLRILKIDKETKAPLYGATFLLYDSKNNLLGEFTTDQAGLITFGQNLQASKYKLKEVKSPDNYVLDATIHTITVTEGETTEIVIENEPIRGRIQITKKASEYNDITKDKAGALLKGAVFEIINSRNEVVDRIETDNRGLATTKKLPLGVYGIREIASPSHYLLESELFYAEIKVHDDLIQFEVLNKPEEISVSVEKRGNVEAMPGDVIRYDFSNIANTSNVPLTDFYWHDLLPTDAVRLNQIHTGTWSERLTYKVTYRTNLKSTYRVLEDKLATNVDNVLECGREALRLAANEYITDIRFEFGEVAAGFHCVDSPYMYATVLGNLPDGYQFTNRTTVGGRTEDEWIHQKDAWTSVIFAPPRGTLPRTGY